MANPSLDFGNGLANGAQNNGQSAINSFNPTQTAQGQQNNSNNLFNIQRGQTNDYINRYSQTVANNPSVTGLYDTANKMFNVPGLASSANYLQNQVTNAIPSAYQGAKGYDIGNTAVQNGVANKLSYLTPQSNAATNNLNTAQGLASNYVNAGMEQNKQNLLPIQAEQQNLLQSQAAQASGWNNAAQSEFQGLIQKMQSGVQLSQQEMERANQLATLQSSYENTLNQITGQQNTARINNQNVLIGQGQTYYNPASGRAYNPFVPLYGQTIRR